MNEAKVFEDSYSGVFRRQEDFLSFLHRIMENSCWKRKKVNNLRLLPITAGSALEDELRSQYADDGIDEEIISDTVANTALVLKSKDEIYPIRDCAIKSILERAGIQGNGLRRVERNVYARILNDILKVTKGEALLRISEGKLSAVLSGDCNDYSILDMEQIFLHTIEYLQKNFSGCRYMGGFYEHDMASAIWTIDEKDLLEAYSSIFAAFLMFMQLICTEAYKRTKDRSILIARIKKTEKKDISPRSFRIFFFIIHLLPVMFAHTGTV